VRRSESDRASNSPMFMNFLPAGTNVRSEVSLV
jgi:hypothetical protein